jgi:hypothetical protein
MPQKLFIAVVVRTSKRKTNFKNSDRTHGDWGAFIDTSEARAIRRAVSAAALWARNSEDDEEGDEEDEDMGSYTVLSGFLVQEAKPSFTLQEIKYAARRRKTKNRKDRKPRARKARR